MERPNYTHCGGIQCNVLTKYSLLDQISKENSYIQTKNKNTYSKDAVKITLRHYLSMDLLSIHLSIHSYINK